MSRTGRPAIIHIALGQTFGKWRVVGPAVSSPKGRSHQCVCECGKERMVANYALTSGKSRSCGCMVIVASRAKATHGDSIRGKVTPYSTWQGMKTRCTNPQVKCYKHYGGRGITICVEWLASYETFKSWAVANGWSSELELDRRDTNGNYCPENCRWVPHAVNMSNCRNTRHVTAWGETKTVSEWATDSRCTVSRSVLSQRLKKNRRTAEQSISIRFMPLGPRPR